MSDMIFETNPDEYKHWKLEISPPLARLSMDVQLSGEDDDADYQRKLNSYDIHVDIELADAVNRLRFEHPEVKVVIVGSHRDRIFCAGANIFMLAGSTHPFKVNFCKFTNETRLGIEDASAFSGQKYIAAVNGTASGGGYELALACDEILLIDDRSSAVSFPEVPLLAVLPGTGGLTRVVDKRRVRRDLADVFSTTAEGVKGRRAVEWGLVDAVHPKSRFEDAVEERAQELASAGPDKSGAGVTLTPLNPTIVESEIRYRHVTMKVDSDARTAEIVVSGPEDGGPDNPASIRELGSDWWALRMFRELDDALLRLRFNHADSGLVLLKTRGEAAHVLAHDAALAAHHADDWFVSEVLHHAKRVLKRLDLTARTFYALADEESCFAGSLLELALAADRTYMLDSPDDPVALHVGPLSAGMLPMANGISRLETRFLDDSERVAAVLASTGPIDPPTAEELGLVTFAPDDLDWDDELRLAIEERVCMSPDALTGMEASLRFAGPETMETKIFGRLSAWQNWIFQRPNAVGDHGALSLYGKPERAQFDWRRTG
jgi:benzoyl-CoA-dihydrodiol lyase